MPQYLLHGFRWTRAQIRIFIIFHNLEDATADYIQTPTTAAVLRAQIFQKYPHLEAKLPNLTFVEQHDPDDLRTGAQPWAFVADTVRAAIPAKERKLERPNGETAAGYELPQGLSLCIGEAIGRSHDAMDAEAGEAMVWLKNNLASEIGDEPLDTDVGWWAVWNGDVERNTKDSEEENKRKEMEAEETEAYCDKKPNGTSESIAS